MVAKPADPEPGNTNALEKENAEMKKELNQIYLNRKISDALASVFGAVLVYVASSCMFELAKIGVRAIALENPGDTLGAALTLLIVTVSYIIVIMYVIWTTVIGIAYTFEEDIEIGAKRLKAFIHGGQKALKENIQEDENPENKTPAKELQKHEETEKNKVQTKLPPP